MEHIDSKFKMGVSYPLMAEDPEDKQKPVSEYRLQNENVISVRERKYLHFRYYYYHIVA